MQPIPAKLRLRFAAYLDIGEGVLLLAGDNDTDEQSAEYSGTLLPGSASFNLTAFANRILGATFHINLPSFFPAILIDALSGTICLATQTLPASYAFQARSSTVIQPLPLVPGLKFKGFDITLANKSGNVIQLASSVLASGALKWLDGLAGELTLVDKAYAVSLRFSHSLGIEGLLHDLFDCEVPAGLASLLPNFLPLSAGQPIRLYHADTSFTLPGGATFAQGYHLDQCAVQMLGLTFAIKFDWQDANNYTFTAAAGTLDFYLFKMVAPSATPAPSAALDGPQVQVVKSPDGLQVKLQADLQFSKPSLTLGLALTAQHDFDVFQGTLTYGQLPPLTIAWSKTKGFQLVDFPLADLLPAGFIDFARMMEQLSEQSSGSCGKMVDLAFSNTVTTSFKTDVELGSGQASNRPGIRVSGTYTVKVFGADICTVPFDPITLTGVIPSSLDDVGQAIATTLQDNALALVQALWNDREAYFKFIAAQSAQKLGKTLTAQLICHGGGEQYGQSVVSEAASDLLKDATSGALDTLAEAAQVFSAASAVLNFFANIAKCLSPSQKREREQADARQQAAQQAINALLAINDLASSYVLRDGQCHATASWTPLSVDDDNASLQLTLVASDGSELAATQPGLHDDAAELAFALTPGALYTVVLQGVYQYNGATFSGQAAIVPIQTATLALAAPRSVYDPEKNTVAANWLPAPAFATPDGTTIAVTQYTVSLWNQTRDAQVAGMRAEIMPFTQPSNPGTYTFALLRDTPPYFVPQPGDTYQVRLSANTSYSVFDVANLQSGAFQIALGVGHSLIGMSFKIFDHQT